MNQVGAFMLIAPTSLIHMIVLLAIAVYNQLIGLSNIIIVSDNFLDQLFISSLPLINPKRLKNKEKLAFSISNDLKEILVGLILGDLHG